MADNPNFEFDDLQGIFRFAHGRLSHSCFLLLKIADPAQARQWLAQVTVTTAENRQPLPDTALQIAFTANGLGKLGLDENVIAGFSAEFLTGIHHDSRSRRLGDIGNSAPSNWDWGSDTTGVPDILLMLYAAPGKLEEWVQKVTDQHFNQSFNPVIELPSNDQVTREPFGFADGLSQPKIDWAERQSTDTHQRNTYSNLVTPGEFILGYPNEYGHYTDRPLLSASDCTGAEYLPYAADQPGLKDLGRNGGYLVLRQLRQDVSGFWQFADRIADGIPDKREQLASAMVGRQRDGEPLIPVTPKPISGISEKNQPTNNFDYNSDPDGEICPIGAHVRRSNPRTGDLPPGTESLIKRILRIFGFGASSPHQDLIASTRYHRILRRGRAYGPELPLDDALAGSQGQEERGLQFICLCANIARQFEFIQNAWIANAKFGGLQNEQDPLLGNRHPLEDSSSTDNFSQPKETGARRHISGIPEFITVRGGAYFFVPGIRALKFITHYSSDAGNGNE